MSDILFDQFFEISHLYWMVGLFHRFVDKS